MLCNLKKLLLESLYINLQLYRYSDREKIFDYTGQRSIKISGKYQLEDLKIKAFSRTVAQYLAYGFISLTLFKAQAVLAQDINQGLAERFVEGYYQKKGLPASSIAHRKIAARTAVAMAERFGTTVLAGIELSQLNKKQITSEKLS